MRFFETLKDMKFNKASIGILLCIFINSAILSKGSHLTTWWNHEFELDSEHGLVLRYNNLDQEWLTLEISTIRSHITPIKLLVEFYKDRFQFEAADSLNVDFSFKSIQITVS